LHAIGVTVADVSAPELESLEIITELLARVLRRQDELEARFQRIEAILGIRRDELATPPPVVGAASAVHAEAAEAPAMAEPTGSSSGSAPAQPLTAGVASPTAEVASPTAEVASPTAGVASPTAGVASPTAAVASPTAAVASLATPADALAATLGASPPKPLEALGAARATPGETTETLESRFGLNWLNRIGVVTLILGVAFAFKTAVDNGWIGPTARVVLGVAAALATLLVGDFQWRRGKEVFAQGLTGLGLAMLYLSFWASCGLYHLLLQPVAFGLMVGTTIASALLALRYGSQAIAVLAMLGGYLTPVVLATGEPHPLIFLGYITLLNLGGLVLSRRRVWPVLEYVVAFATCVLYAGWWATSATSDDRPIASVFAVVFYVQLSSARARSSWRFAQVLGPGVVAGLWHDAQILIPLLLVFVVGGLVVAELRRWRGAPLWTMIWFWGPVLGCAALRDAPPDLAFELAWASIGFAMFFAWILWWHLRQKRALHEFDLALVIANAAAYLGMALLLLEPEHHAVLGLFTIGLAAAHFVLARWVWRLGGAAKRDPWPGTVALGVALVLVTLAVPLQFTELAITVGWALEGAILAWLSARFASEKLSLVACAVLVLAMLSLFPLDAQIYEPAEGTTAFVNPRFATLAVLAGSLFVAARSLRELPRATSAYVLGHLVVLGALGFEIAGWIERSVAEDDRFGSVVVAISILMALYAVLLIAAGVVRRSARDRILGLVLMGIVVVKLYAHDVWALGRGFQVAAFLGLGALLLLVSYLYSRYRSVIERLWKDPA
jgi:uncharacterized membrane protein